MKIGFKKRYSMKQNKIIFKSLTNATCTIEQVNVYEWVLKFVLLRHSQCTIITTRYVDMSVYFRSLS